MLGAIAHRGPDDQGLAFFDIHRQQTLHCATQGSVEPVRASLPAPEAVSRFPHQLAFAHCRFSIVDLTAAGHQPMHDDSGRLCISYNGEIYNYVELREELERAGMRFRTRSDTEVLLAGFAHWGTEVFQRLNGQWALSLYDGGTRTLWLSRDRLGKVPLYYTTHENRFYWASEIKALLGVCGTALTVRDRAVDDYVRHGWRDRDGTFWNEVHDFPPAHFASIDDSLALRFNRFWQLPGERLPESAISPEEAAQGVARLLGEAIRIRTRADVPVAFELSGGLDSSSVVALAARGSTQRIGTYSIAFADASANEEPYARAVAEQYRDRIDYRVIRPGDEDFWRDADQFVWLEEEPFHAPNLLTNQSLRRRMREDGTKVVISGAAGDELFAGYHTDYFSPYLRRLILRRQWARAVHELRASSEIQTWKHALVALMDAVVPGLPDRLRASRSREQAFLDVCFRSPPRLAEEPAKRTSLEALMAANMGSAKMNYWLRSANKSNFGIPIEPRAPYLDYRLVDYAFSLPVEYLIRDGWHKWVLRKALEELLPAQVLWRKQKMGFPFPITTWLLASQARALSAISGSSCPYLDGARIAEHYIAMARTTPFVLWRLICLALWWQRVIRGHPIAPGIP
jgi:asparagine synthase (glutamine-hydrolysing)